MRCDTLLFSMLSLLLCAVPAASASLRLQPASSIDASRISNPAAAAGDVILPMPGGLSMALRAIWLPASGFLDETELYHGIGTQLTDATTYVEQRYRAAMTAPFTLKDIPQAWPQDTRNWLAAEAKKNASKSVVPYMYFIGKYEVTRGQWRAIMGTETYVPKPGDERPAAILNGCYNIIPKAYLFSVRKAAPPLFACQPKANGNTPPGAATRCLPPPGNAPHSMRAFPMPPCRIIS